MRKVRNQKGFTIMELMIVIVIIGILIAIAIPAYNNFRDTATARACQSNERVIRSAVGLYYAENNAYPADTDALTPDYMDPIPTCPEDAANVYSIAADGSVDCNGVSGTKDH